MRRPSAMLKDVGVSVRRSGRSRDELDDERETVRASARDIVEFETWDARRVV